MKLYALSIVLCLTSFFGLSSASTAATMTASTDMVTSTGTSFEASATTTSPLTQCLTTCLAVDHKYCQIINGSNSDKEYWDVSCSCQVGYLPIGSDCVSDDLIIGVSVGVGAAIILGLTIAVICLAVRKPLQSAGKSDHSKSSVGSEAQLTNPAEMVIKTSSQQGAGNPGTAVVELSGVGTETNVDGHTAGAAAAAVAVVAAADVNAVAGAAVVASTGADHKPQSNNLQPVEVSTPQYDLSQPMPLNTQFYNNSDIEATMTTFVPQLQNVDTLGNYSIKRPTTLNQSGPPQNPPGPSNPDYKYF